MVYYLEKEVSIDKSDRFYLIWRSDSGSLKGKFLFGHRKRAPWEGFGNIIVEDESDIAE